MFEIGQNIGGPHFYGVGKNVIATEVLSIQFVELVTISGSYIIN